MELIRFIDVGRGKSCWTDKIENISFEALDESVRSHARLASREINYDYDDEINRGFITAGFHTVGHFERVLTIAKAEGE